MQARLALVGCLLLVSSASCCSLVLRPGLRVKAISADGNIIQLKLSFSESTYSYDGDDAPCGSAAVLQYDWASGELRPGLDFSERDLDLGPRLDLSCFDVIFRVGGVSVTDKASGAAVDFVLSSLESPGRAHAWQSNGRLYVYYSLGTAPSSRVFELAICSLSEGSCVLDSARDLQRYLVLTGDEWNPAVFEEASVVQLSTMDSCFQRLYFYSGPAAVPSVPSLSDASKVSTLVRGESLAGPNIIFNAVIAYDGALVLERTDLATGQTARHTLGGAAVREQMLRQCFSPSPPPLSQADDQAGSEDGTQEDVALSGCC
jgi:hypothetical protein